MKRTVLTTALVAAIALLSATAAFGAAHFQSGPTFTINNAGQLVCSGDVAGLGSVESVEGTCSATSQATYQCINNGGKNPAAGNKTTTTGLVSGGGSFAVRNGRVKDGTTTVSPNGPGSFSCPGGQTLYLVAVCYESPTYTIGDATATGETVCRDGLMVRQ